MGLVRSRLERSNSSLSYMLLPLCIPLPFACHVMNSQEAEQVSAASFDSPSMIEDVTEQEFAFSRVAYRRVGPAGIEGAQNNRCAR